MIVYRKIESLCFCMLLLGVVTFIGMLYFQLCCCRHSNPDAPPFAVVSGELTLDSLRVLMDRALPQCRGVNSQYECLLLDDRGNLVYRNDLNNIRNISSFLGRDINLLRPLLFQSGGSWTRMQQCQDLFNVNIDTNRFFTVRGGCTGKGWVHR